MSRFDGKQNEPDYDRYETRPVEDIDVPDFDLPDPPVDPAEHAAHALIDALTTFEQQIALCGDKDLERAHMLRGMVLRHEQHAARVTNQASAKVDEILERRR